MQKQIMLVLSILICNGCISDSKAGIPYQLIAGTTVALGNGCALFFNHNPMENIPLPQIIRMAIQAGCLVAPIAVKLSPPLTQKTNHAIAASAALGLVINADADIIKTLVVISAVIGTAYVLSQSDNSVRLDPSTSSGRTERE